jgi:hypothetical protein
MPRTVVQPVRGDRMACHSATENARNIRAVQKIACAPAASLFQGFRADTPREDVTKPATVEEDLAIVEDIDTNQIVSLADTFVDAPVY